MSGAGQKKKISIGDIVEIRTPAGLAFVQYTHDAGTSGELVRVLPGLYEHRPADFATLSRKKELYFIFYTMNYAVRAGQADVVSNRPVPNWATNHPVMRHAAGLDDFGRVTRWRIISAASRLTPEDLTQAPVFTELTKEQRKLSIRELWSHATIVRQLARSWTPERAEEFRVRDVTEAATRTPPDTHAPEAMKYYFYFPSRENAELAGEQLSSRGFSVQVRKDEGGKDWLTLALKLPPKTGDDMDELRDELEMLARQFGGEYDGWEAAIDSLDSGAAHQNLSYRWDHRASLLERLPDIVNLTHAAAQRGIAKLGT